MMFDEGESYSPAEVFGCINSFPNSKKLKMINKRRFSDEQVRSLESIFENETKLEPKKKVQVARELGLQPRQVAIWFQNKRARYKSKQLERDYSILRANYNALASQFENLKKEQQSLVIQLQNLKELEEKAQPQNQCCNNSGTTNSIESQSDNKKSESDNTNKSDQGDAKPALSLEGSEYGACSILSDEGSSENTHYFGMEEEADILTMVQPVDGSLTSAERWDDLHSDDLFGQPVDSCELWDFWS